MRELGATAEQIDRERERVHQELVAKPNQGHPSPATHDETHRRAGEIAGLSDPKAAAPNPKPPADD
jgi:hypothetical protein